MWKRVYFYLKQAVSQSRKSILIVLGLGLAISMVAGLGFYSDSYQQVFLEDSLNQFMDFDVKFSDRYNINVSDVLDQKDSVIISKFNNLPFDIESVARYGYFDSNYGEFYVNYTALGINVSDYTSLNQYRYLRSYESSSMKFLFGDENLYNSERFQSNFYLFEGQYPQNESEIMIDLTMAQHFNYTVGSIVNLNVKVSNYSYDYGYSGSVFSWNYVVPDMTVSGIIGSKNDYIQFGYEGSFYASYDFSENLDKNIMVSSMISHIPIFTYYNFTAKLDQHPFQELLRTIKSDNENFRMENSYGVAAFYNRDSINFNKINSLSRTISREMDIFRRSLPDGVYLYDYLSQSLSYIYQTTTILRWVLQIMNVPILLFALFIGMFSIKTKMKGRIDEFLLQRSKGMPSPMIRNQILMEGVLNGLLASAIGVLLGMGTFYGYRYFLGDLFSYGANTSPLTPRYTWDTIGMTFFFGTILSVLSTSGARFVLKTKSHDLLKMMGQDDFDIIYDEKSLFEPSQNSQVQNSIGYIAEQPQIRKNEKPKKKYRKIKQNQSNFYENQIAEKENKNPKLSIFFILISMFPLLLYLILYIGNLPNVPDSIINFVEKIQLYISIFNMLSITSPIFLTIGIIRLLVVEKPSRFAKISKFLSSLFLKNKSYLCGIEMVRRKQYRTVIYIVGVFVALLTFSNVLLNTLSRENVITTNLNIGADINANVMEGSLYASNSSEITLWEQNITAFRLHDDQVLFNDVLTCYVESSQDESRGYSSEFYYLNLEKYLDITSEGEKFVPSQSYERNLEYVIDYNNDPSSTLPGIIVNQRYCDYNQKIIGDTIQINHTYFNSSNNEVSSVVLDAKIIAVLDMVPGIYQSENYWSYGKEIIIMDVASLNSDLDLLHGQELIQLLDININVENNETIITSAIRNASADFGYHASIQYYNQDWNEVNIQMDQSEIGFFGIIYLEFIIIGGLMAFGIAILLLSLQRDNKYFNGVLLARGFGKKGILKFVLSQLFIIYFISLITGLVGGFLTSSIFLKVETLSISYLGVEFPIFLNPVELISVLSIITASSFIIYFVAYFFESRKNITQYFHKF